MLKAIDSNKSENHLVADCGSGALLGTGILTWNRRERVMDRYGTIRLGKDPDAETNGTVALCKCRYDMSLGSFHSLARSTCRGCCISL